MNQLRRGNDAALAQVRWYQRHLTREIKLPGLTPRIAPDEVVMFARSLSMMTEAGLPVLDCFRVLTEQTDKQAFRRVIRRVARDVAEGTPLAAALEKHPEVFDTLFVRMVAAGEAGGVLPELLRRVALFIEKSVTIKRKIKAAMVYPAVITGVATVTVGILLVYVIPVFAEVYGDLGQTLPTPTRLTIFLSQWLKDHVLLLLFVVSSTLLGVRVTYRTPRGRAAVDGWLLALPVLGVFVRKVGVVRFAHNMSALLGAGVTAVDSLSITAETLGNKSMATRVLQTRDRLREGETLARTLAVSQVFPPMVCHLIAVGENTGALDKVLRNIASFYEEEVDRAIQQLNALMEPAIMLILGIVLGAIVVSMYLPIFQMGNLVQ